MSLKAIDLRKGMGVYYRDQVWVVHSSKHVPKGKGRSYQQIELKSVTDGTIIRERFRTESQLDQAIFDRKTMEYLYSDGDRHVVMDMETYEQIELPDELIGDQRVYLTPNIPIEVSFVEGRVVSAELPNTVELTVVDVPPAVKGATVTNQLKDATCEGGARVRVPSFVENGTVIKVDTRSGEYLGRA
ncbi:MAG: elongation factor P [Planctomycetota bacterium]